MTLQIRPAGENDYEAVKALMRESQALHSHALPHIFADTARVLLPAWYRSYLGTDKRIILLAEWEESPAGFAMLEKKEAPGYPAFVPRTYTVLNEIGVARAYRRKGIGTSLVHACTGWSLAQGAGSLELTVWEFNEGARKFYESLGMHTLNRTLALKLPNGANRGRRKEGWP